MGDYYNYAGEDDSNTLCPAWASILGFSGCVVAVVFASELYTCLCHGEWGGEGNFF